MFFLLMRRLSVRRQIFDPSWHFCEVFLGAIKVSCLFSCSIFFLTSFKKNFQAFSRETVAGGIDIN